MSLLSTLRPPHEEGRIYATSRGGVFVRALSSFRVALYLILSVVMLVSVAPIVFNVGSGSTSAGGSVVNAQEEEKKGEETESDTLKKAQEQAKKSISDYIKDVTGGGDEEEEDGDESTAYDKLARDSDGNAEETSLKRVMQRFIGIYYINKTPLGADDTEYCRKDAPGAGTVIYHNCDVPNLLTRFVQKLAADFGQTGPQNALRDSATLDNPAFGLPDNIPGGGAPANPTERAAKYTALELIGYNLNFTSYVGEWDNIKIMGAAKGMTSIGAFEKVKATFKAFVKGYANSESVQVRDFTEQISSGDIFGAISAMASFPIRFIKSLFGGATGVANAVFDMNDEATFRNYAWYRDDFGATMYNARALTQEEMANEVQKLIIEFLGDVELREAEVPDDLKSIQDPPQMPQNEISYCSVVEQTEATPSPGISEEACKAAWEALMASARAAEATTGVPASLAVPEFEWTVDGTRKREPLKDYIYGYSKVREGEPEYFEIARKYGVQCFPDEMEGVDNKQIETGAGFVDNKAAREYADGSQETWDKKIPEPFDTRNEYGSKIISCWEEGYEKAVDKILKTEQNENNKEETDKKLNPEKFLEWVNQDPENRNYNAPWRRFICLDKNGNDMKNGDDFVFIYHMNGTRNAACGETRQPIQDGLFGNGYLKHEQPLKDTRNFANKDGIVSSFLPVSSIMDRVSNSGLRAAATFTRFSNSMLNASYGSTMDKIGLDKIVVRMVEELRDSMYAPLLVLLMSLSGMVVFMRIIRQRQFVSAWGDIGKLVGVAFLGTALLTNPQKFVTQMEEIPATVEKGILSAVFDPTLQEKDQLCTTGSKNLGVTEDDKGGEKFDTEVVRRMTCENWRVSFYNPYVMGQWGTDPASLDVDNMRNMNGNRVGNAEVKMGNGISMNNWALYQADVLTSGTASKAEPTQEDGITPRDFYRIVDMQAGPENGAGTDNRYFDMWSGRRPGIRFGAGMLAGVNAAIIAATVTTYSINKVYLNVVSTLMIGLMPFMLLAGLVGDRGRGKMKAYFLTLLALIIQRIMLAGLMGIMFTILLSTGGATTNVIISMFTTTVISLIFLMERENILKLVTKEIPKATGGEGAPDFVEHDKVNGWLENKLQRANWGAKALVGGTLGGYAAGGANSALRAGQRMANQRLQYIRRQQRYLGKGKFQTFTEAYSRAASEARNDLMERDVVKSAAETGYNNSKAKKKFDEKLAQYNLIDAEEVSNYGVRGKFDGEKFVAKPYEDGAKATSRDFSNRAARRISLRSREIARADTKIDTKLKKRGIHLDDKGDAYKKTESGKLVPVSIAEQKEIDNLVAHDAKRKNALQQKIAQKFERKSNRKEQMDSMRRAMNLAKTWNNRNDNLGRRF